MPKTILFASCGTHPAQLTQAVWALARETPRVVPDAVVAVGSTFGVNQVKAQLLEARHWRELCRELEKSGVPKDELAGKLILSTQVIRGPDEATKTEVELDDIRTNADNERTADFLIRELGKYAYDPETRLIVLLSGGRKTVGSLLSACMSLIGREQDRLVHVIPANEYVDAGVASTFYYPKSGCSPVAPAGTKKLPPPDQAITLVDIPFIPLRAVFSERQNRVPVDFMGEVRRVRKCLDKTRTKPLLVVGEPPAPGASLNGEPLRLGLWHWIVLRHLARQALAAGSPAVGKGQKPVPVMTVKELAAHLAAVEFPLLLAHRGALEAVWGVEVEKLENTRFDEDRLKAIVSELRKLLGKAAGCDGQTIIPARNYRLTPEGIAVRVG